MYTQNPKIEDEQRLKATYFSFDRPCGKDSEKTQIKVYDDGFGPLWVHYNEYGVVGVIRAQSFETAYEIAQDEFMQKVPEDEVHEAYGWSIRDYSDPNRILGSLWQAAGHHGIEVYSPEDKLVCRVGSMEEAHTFCQTAIAALQPELAEGYQYQPNATGTGIIYEGPYGGLTELLNEEQAEDYRLWFEIVPWDEED